MHINSPQQPVHVCGKLGHTSIGDAKTLRQFQDSFSADWFASSTNFACLALKMDVDMPDHIHDGTCARGIIVALQLGLVHVYKKCHKCTKKVVLRITPRPDKDGMRCECTCTAGGHKGDHLRETLTGKGPLEKIKVASWAPFFHMILMLRRNDRWTSILSELSTGYGIICHKPVTKWRRSYQQCLKANLISQNALAVGGDKEVAVFDETVVGLVGKAVSTRTDRRRSTSASAPAVRARIAKTLPARTIWRARRMMKKPAMKRPAGVAGTRKDLRSNARWLWLCVTVGKGKECYTHENKKKRITFALLPRKDQAPSRRPRGLISMRNVIQSHIKKKTFLVFDGWKSSTAAVKQLGYRHAPAVNHTTGWRDRVTGFHSNDVESENARFKTWLRCRYTRLKGIITDKVEADVEDDNIYEDKEVELLDLYEYCHYINLGDTMKDIAFALASQDGGCERRHYLI